MQIKLLVSPLVVRVHAGCSASPFDTPKKNVTVADPGPLMPGVLDRWTPTVNV